MAVTVTDQRTTLDQADAATNFNTGAQNSALYAEADYSIAYAYNITTGQIYYNGTCPNFTAGPPPGAAQRTALARTRNTSGW